MVDAVAQIAVLAAACSTSAAAGKVCVADEGSNTVSVIDAATFKKIGSIPVGQGAHNVQVAPDGTRVWITNNGEPAKAAEKMPPEGMAKSEHAAMAGAGAVWAIDTTTDRWSERCRSGCIPPMSWWRAMAATPISRAAARTASAWWTLLRNGSSNDPGRRVPAWHTYQPGRQ
ncbi:MULTISPECIES: hypothetical protein [unclassified Variovorax]|uniref:YncE family protein n=1 Tax=unclassified Variovorax TaxID=663243 RepID=UPI001E46713E|nr:MULTISPECIES: hypothetical protein [unclassified Variovorax]